MKEFFNKLAGKSDLIATMVGNFTFGIALASYAWLGTYSRLYADDYCMSGLVAERGFWQAQLDQYTGWSNRFAGMFVLSLSDYFGTGFFRLWTALVLLAWLAALAWALIALTRYLRIAISRLACLMLAECIIFFTILFSPQVYQSFFWRVGIMT